MVSKSSTSQALPTPSLNPRLASPCIESVTFSSPSPSLSSSSSSLSSFSSLSSSSSSFLSSSSSSSLSPSSSSLSSSSVSSSSSFSLSSLFSSSSSLCSLFSSSSSSSLSPPPPYSSSSSSSLSSLLPYSFSSPPPCPSWTHPVLAHVDSIDAHGDGMADLFCTHEWLPSMPTRNALCFSGTDEHLLTPLNQHFKVKELGLLAHSLCAPLVSIRVGKVQWDGRILCPTNSRGYLNLTMLPRSFLHISYVGDDGCVERIALLKPGIEHPPAFLQVLSSDATGRSFVMKLPDDKQVFFWQSEKSKEVGNELLRKMKDLLLRHPSLTQIATLAGNSEGHNSRYGPMWHNGDLDSGLPIIPSASHGLLSTLGNGFSTPFQSSHLSVSRSSSVLAPYYCPCPLRSSSHSPFTNQAGSISLPILSQASIIGLDRVNLSPIPLPVSSLVNIPTPLQTSTFPPFFSDPIVHIPLIDVQSGTQSFIVSTPLISSSGYSPMIPNFLNNISSRKEGQPERENMPALNSFEGSGKSEVVQSNRDNEPFSFVADLPHVGFMESRLSGSGNDGEKESCFDIFGKSPMPPSDILYEIMPIVSNCDDLLHCETSLQLDRPFLGVGMLPTMHTSGSLSSVLSFGEDMGKRSTVWLSGQSFEADIPVSTYHNNSKNRIQGNIITSLKLVDSREVSSCWTSIYEEKSPKREEKPYMVSNTCVGSSVTNPSDIEKKTSEENTNSQYKSL